ncbi:MAG: GNAT family N-acetyltransferase [Candidatus Kapabacteria bacterium]|jgi:ribosomal-protein-alanine N-acetyltransferase|nr:GNAT family N-acetyltransferase [Candidatus Kapabacteria bacterium]
MNIRIETKRLTIFPLSYDQQVDCLACDFSLERKLGVNLIKRTISEPLKEVIEHIILPNLKENLHLAHYISTWIIIDKIQNAIVGSFIFKGIPNENGEIEIGYGTEPTFFGKGYMTEAVGGLVLWAENNLEINALIAETEINNIASQKVLINNNFTQSNTNEEMIWWKLTTNK